MRVKLIYSNKVQCSDITCLDGRSSCLPAGDVYPSVFFSISHAIFGWKQNHHGIHIVTNCEPDYGESLTLSVLESSCRSTEPNHVEGFLGSKVCIRGRVSSRTLTTLITSGSEAYNSTATLPRWLSLVANHSNLKRRRFIILRRHPALR